jgi:hypothetical protein
MKANIHQNYQKKKNFSLNRVPLEEIIYALKESSRIYDFRTR